MGIRGWLGSTLKEKIYGLHRSAAKAPQGGSAQAGGGPNAGAPATFAAGSIIPYGPLAAAASLPHFISANQGTGTTSTGVIVPQSLLAAINRAVIGSAMGYLENLKALPRVGIEAGEIIAWRCWRANFWDGPRLLSMSNDFAWIPGQAPRAACMDKSCDYSIEDHGTVGFYAFKHAKDVMACFGDHAVSSPVVFGQVELWGDVIEHKLGYRAEYAAVHSLLGGNINQEDLDRLRRVYGVEMIA